MPNKLLIATNNNGKINELRLLLRGLPFELLALGDIPDVCEVDETGRTFSENACLKASGYALQTGLLSIADDSGLEIAALDGRPGVLSARYGGDGTNFVDKMSLLLDELQNAGATDRRARFVCSIAISGPDGWILSTTEGICSGQIAPKPLGSHGFGYDPVFMPDGFNQTFGELDDTVKQQISHRSRAFQEIMPFLRHFTAV